MSKVDPTGSRDPAIDEMLGELFESDMAAAGIETVCSGQAERSDRPERLKIDIITTPTHVVIELSKAVRWLNLPPELAIDLGNAIRKWGRKVIKSQVGK